MFPYKGSSSSTPDPNYNPASAAAESHSQPSSSSSSTSSAMIAISAGNPSINIYMHQQQQNQYIQDQRAAQQQSLINLQPLPYLSTHYGAPAAELAPTEGASRYAAYMQPPATLTREEAQQLFAGQHPTLGPAPAHSAIPVQALSIMPSNIEQLYNEQLLRSFRGRIQGAGIEPRSMYDSLQQQVSAANPGSSSVLSRTLESIGRAAPSEGAAASGRYEETCTPRPRWCPTQEQIQILESLFNSGTTTPSRDMIVDIAAQLRKYGTIAEANVFYWFQNRKARAKRKLQPPPALHMHSPPVSSASAPASVEPDRGSMHTLTPVGHLNVVSPATHEQSTQSKSRRLSLKHASASSPTSSSSPDHHQYVSSSGPASSSPLQQQPTSSNKPFAHQLETTLVVPNRSATLSTAALARTDQSIFFNPWPYNQLERQTQEPADVDPHSSMPSTYPHPLLQKHVSTADTQIEAFQKVLEYPRISLSLAPPTDQHPSSQGFSHAQAPALGYNTPYSDHQLLQQATSKGVMLINPPAGVLGGDPIIGASSGMSSVVFSHLGSSGRAATTELGSAATECSQLQPHALPQSSLPLVRPAEYQAGSTQTSTSTQSGPSALTGSEQEQLQMWEDLESCGGPWNGTGQGQGPHQS